jgi:hypothetical protein
MSGPNHGPTVPEILLIRSTHPIAALLTREPEQKLAGNSSFDRWTKMARIEEPRF